MSPYDESIKTAQRGTRSRLVIACTAVAFLVSGGVYWYTRPTAEELVKRARAAFAVKDYSSTLSLAKRALATGPESSDALLLAGGASVELENFGDAVEFYERVSKVNNAKYLESRAISSHLLLFKLGRAAEAEQQYRDILAVDPKHPVAVAGLANLLGLAGRRREATPYLIELIRQGRISVNQLTLLGSESGGFSDVKLHQFCLQNSACDPFPMMGLSWQASHDGKQDECKKWTLRALECAPDLIEAHARLGRILVLQGRYNEIPRWNAGLPDDAEQHPEIWLIRGEFQHHHGLNLSAARCFWEAIRKDPNLRVAIHQLVQTLIAEGKQKEATPFIERLRRLQELTEYQSFLFESKHTSLEPIRNVARQMEQLGRNWESYGWSHFASQIDPRATWPRHRCARLLPRLHADTPLTLQTENPAYRIDLSDLPLPNWTQVGDSQLTNRGEDLQLDSRVRFLDQAEEVGVNFEYFNSGDPASHGQRMYEFSGGGVGVVDYDLDGWPDLYLTQGCRWPVDSADRQYLDRLYRNEGGQRFVDVTESAQIAETGFSQGVAVGDFNSDGMPDLYVANVGRNSLYLNNGDGTFSDASSYVQDDEKKWTTSCLMADLDGDGDADIYNANYLTGPDLFTRICSHKDGMARMCAPFDFPGARDQFFANDGEGEFRDRTTAAGFDVENGKGLGLVAADFDGSGGLSLFIANDLVPNFFFHRRTGHEGQPMRFVESGLERGVAFDVGGRAQGSMGIAIGDADSDGQLDLFVTNFSQEYNAFYVQKSGGLFQDEIRSSGIAEATLPVLGFGAEFIDGELDGHLDLVVTNGQVDDHRKYGRAWKMKPQYFRNMGQGTFAEVESRSLGPFFERTFLGRALARLDWNRDGLEDIALSHLDDPAALLTNVTSPHGHFVAVRLVAVHSHRDAVGTTVILKWGDMTRVQQLVAGDGYQVSNQRQLVFGTGSETNVDSIEVHWPSGRRQRFTEVSVDSELLLIEDCDRPLLLPR